MPFYTLYGSGEAEVILKQIGDNSFEVMRGFRYDVPNSPKSYIVPAGFRTDLASVPWLLWWLVASHGRHTRAALVHDTLIGADASTQIPRKEADWILYTALEDTAPGEKKGSWLRHQMIWVAVCLFGTMRQCAKFLLALYLINLAVFWFAVITSLLGWSPWWSSRVGWIVAGAAGVAGFLWTFNPQADRRLAFRLWPVGAFALPLVTPAFVVALGTVALIAAVDALPALIQHRKWPIFPPYRVRFPA
jgi:uncharacterized protein DUF1353